MSHHSTDNKTETAWRIETVERGAPGRHPGGAKKVIYAAILANTGIAASKFIAAAITGSASMVAEGIHSSVDTGNEILLLLGLRHSMRQPDATHPFGYGKAIYFWALIVALSVFTLGGGVSIYHGVLSLQDPHPVESTLWNYIVLVVAAIFELYSWLVSRKELNHLRRSGENLWHAVRRSQDPAVFTVFIEDSAALIGIAIALTGIGLGQWLNNPYIDPVASIFIGLVLIWAAVILARETGGLIVGESVDEETLSQLRKSIYAEVLVEDVGQLLTMHLGPGQVLLVAAVRFKRGIRIEELDFAIARLERSISATFPFIQKVFFNAGSALST